MSYKPVNTYGPLATNADNAVVFTLTGNGQDNDTYQLGSVEGAMDVFGSGDGTNFLATPIALTDLTATAPATRVVETTATKHYQFSGRYKAIQVLQKGATAVTGAYVITTESA
jgi:hypothetical protein